MNTTANATPPPTRTGHIEVRGVNYYYEIRGKGEPLLLLHGGLFSIDMFGPNLGILSTHHEVIAVDMHGHGRTTLGDRPISPIDMGDDMAAIVQQLGYRQVDALGYSLGGNVALRVAIQHPDAVRRLVLLSTPFAQDGFFPEMLPQQAAVGAAMAPMMMNTPIYQSYMARAPHPDDFPRLLDRMGEYLRQPFNWAVEIKTLKMPVMLVYGDGDMFRPEHIVEFYHLLGGGLKDAGWRREDMPKNRLAILPDLTHYEIGAAPAFGHAVLPFLNSETT
jgi:pimeloyl-ACP methyl ester carboxylesterase